jgi:hypothetical protein
VATVARKGRARRFREARAFKQGFGDRPLDEAFLSDIVSTDVPQRADDEDGDEDDDDVDAYDDWDEDDDEDEDDEDR